MHEARSGHLATLSLLEEATVDVASDRCASVFEGALNALAALAKLEVPAAWHYRQSVHLCIGIKLCTLVIAGKQEACESLQALKRSPLRPHAVLV